jgi:RNA polymerase sigma factor (sigma-70 family)
MGLTRPGCGIGIDTPEGQGWMKDKLEEFAALMDRVRQGSEEAARELYQRYGRHLVRVVRTRLNKKLRSKFDSSDFTQAVWASFFAMAPHVELADRPETVVAFLVRMANNKVLDAVRQRLATAKYNVARESSIEDLTDRQFEQLVAPEPTPSQIAMAREEWDRALYRMPRLHRRILMLAQEGRTCQEIATALRLNRDIVRRILRHLLVSDSLADQPRAGNQVAFTEAQTSSAEERNDRGTP